MEKDWHNFLPKAEKKKQAKYFLPLGYGRAELYGIHMTYKKVSKAKSYDTVSNHWSCSHDSLKEAFLGDLMQNPKAIASTLVRLQKAESRLADYTSNFPGIFFTQRPDMTFSYLSKGIRKLFPNNTKSFQEMVDCFYQ